MTPSVGEWENPDTAQSCLLRAWRTGCTAENRGGPKGPGAMLPALAMLDSLEISPSSFGSAYDDAQERGEVQKPGGDRTSIVAGSNNAPTAADLGLRRDEIHEARRLRKDSSSRLKNS